MTLRTAFGELRALRGREPGTDSDTSMKTAIRRMKNRYYDHCDLFDESSFALPWNVHPIQIIEIFVLAYLIGWLIARMPS